MRGRLSDLKQLVKFSLLHPGGYHFFLSFLCYRCNQFVSNIWTNYHKEDFKNAELIFMFILMSQLSCLMMPVLLWPTKFKKHFIDSHYLKAQSISQPWKEIFFVLLMDTEKNDMAIHPSYLQNSDSHAYMFYVPEQVHFTSSWELEA